MSENFTYISVFSPFFLIAAGGAEGLFTAHCDEFPQAQAIWVVPTAAKS